MLQARVAMGSSTSRMESVQVQHNTVHCHGYKTMHLDAFSITSHTKNWWKTNSKTSKQFMESIKKDSSASAVPMIDTERLYSQSEQSWSSLCLLANTFSQLYEMRQKYEDARERADHLNDELRERNRHVKELCVIIHELNKTALEHRKQIEFQRNQIGVQQGMLHEMHIGLQLMDRDGTQAHVARGIAGKLGGAPREYFILRKYCRSLVSMTKPVIGRVIRAACDAGLVSRDIGTCAEKCPGKDHDCADEFYKALQFTVNQRPTALLQFLHIVQDKVPSPSCQQLCKTIQAEVKLI